MAKSKDRGKSRGAKAGNSKTTTKAAKPKKIEAKATIEQVNDKAREEVFFRHKRKIKPLYLAFLAAQKEYDAACGLAKEEGVPKADFVQAFKLEDKKTGAEAEQKLGRKIKRSLWICKMLNLPLGTQGDLFGNTTVTKADHFAAGRVAALNDELRKPPLSLSQKDDAQEWMNGYDEGRVLRNVDLGQGFKPLSEAVDAVVGIIPLPETIGTEAPSYQEAH